MAETCLQVPARVFGFESNAELPSQQRGPGSAQLEQRAQSLLTTLLKESSSRPVPTPSAYMETSDTEETDEEQSEMELDDEEEQENAAAWGILREGEPNGSQPVPIPSTSEAFLKAQREALKRFVYMHQIEEMRRQCAVYFSRQARFEGRASETSVSTPPPAPSGPVEPAKSATRTRMPGQRMPGF